MSLLQLGTRPPWCPANFKTSPTGGNLELVIFKNEVLVGVNHELSLGPPASPAFNGRGVSAVR